VALLVLCLSGASLNLRDGGRQARRQTLSEVTTFGGQASAITAIEILMPLG
jgi:hypothetical protein